MRAANLWPEGKAMTVVEIRSREITPTSAMREFVNRRAASMLGRYRQELRTATLHVRDINGPRGGNDKQCVLAIAGMHAGSFVVEATEASFYTAVDQVMKRAGQALRRKIGRRRRTARVASTRRRVQPGKE
jgi:ribosomal subunit interface protein